MIKAVLSILIIGVFVQVKAQQDRFIGGLIFDLNGIGLVGNTGQYWNSSTDNDGVGHGGISCGAFAKREFTNKIYTNFEIRYSTKGSYYSFVNSYGSKSSESLYLNYVELPILFGYKYKPREKTYFMEFGIEYSKLVKSKIEANDMFHRIYTPDTKNFKSNDFSYTASLKFPLIKKVGEEFFIWF